MIPAAILALVVLVLVARSVIIVPQGTAFVLDRLGRFDRVLQPGLHVVLPFITSVRARVPLGTQTVDVAPQSCPTRDGAAATCSGSVTFRVLDPALAVSSVADYRAAVAQTLSRAWSEAIAASEATGAPLAVQGAHAPAAPALAALGLELVESRPLVSLSDDVERRLAVQARAERDVRVVAWARERGQSPAPDGRPTAAQHAAYDEWIALEIRAHQREIDAARQAAEAATSFRPPPAFAAAPAPAVQFAVARGSIAPGALGTVEAGGREWTARNLSATEIAPGFRCAVERQEGETLFVRAI
jgi:regulator of protease activity HflC (stomatin/prohibitin superfamily)